MDARTAALFHKAWPQQLVFTGLLLALIFAPAGTLRFWQGWLFVGVFAALSIGLGLYFVKHDPALVERRMQVGPAAESEPTQKRIIAAILVVFVLLLVVPGLDHRWHWSHLPPWLVVLADAGIVVSFVVLFVVMKQNSYAASTVRVEPNQPVISTGLYGLVRHPMYAGALLLTICMPLALGSSWSLPLLMPGFALLAWRLIDEERFLKQPARLHRVLRQGALATGPLRLVARHCERSEAIQSRIFRLDCFVGYASSQL